MLHPKHHTIPPPTPLLQAAAAPPVDVDLRELLQLVLLHLWALGLRVALLLHVGLLAVALACHADVLAHRHCTASKRAAAHTLKAGGGTHRWRNPSQAQLQRESSWSALRGPEAGGRVGRHSLLSAPAIQAETPASRLHEDAAQRSSTVSPARRARARRRVHEGSVCGRAVGRARSQRVELLAATRHAEHERGGGDEPVVGAQDEGAQPGRAVDEVHVLVLVRDGVVAVLLQARCRRGR